MRKSTGLFSFASNHSSRQCLRKIKIDKDFTRSYWLALQIVDEKKRNQAGFFPWYATGISRSNQDQSTFTDMSRGFDS